MGSCAGPESELAFLTGEAAARDSIGRVSARAATDCLASSVVKTKQRASVRTMHLLNVTALATGTSLHQCRAWLNGSIAVR